MTIRSQFTSLPSTDLDRPRGQGYGARVNSTYFRLAPSGQVPIQVNTRDVLAQRQDQSPSNVYENTLDVGFEFVRQDLSGGEGLDFFPRRFARQAQEQDATRFWRSANLEIQRPPPGKEFTIKLAPNADRWHNLGPLFADEAVPFMVANQSALYFATNEDTNSFIFRQTNATTTTASGHQLTDGGITANQRVRMIATSEFDTVAILREHFKIHVKLADDGVTDWVDVPNGSGETEDITGIWNVKDRWVVWRRDAALSGAGTLEEMDLGITGAAGTPTFTPTFVTIDSMEAPALHVADGGTAILCCTADGYIRSYVPAQQSADASDVFLELRGRTRMPTDEVPIATFETQGTVLVMTQKLHDTAEKASYRLYKAVLLDERFDFVLGELQLLREWIEVKELGGIFHGDGDLIHEGPHSWRFQGTRDQIHFRIYTDEPISTDTDTDHYVFDVVTQGLFRYRRDRTDNTHAQVTQGPYSLVVWRNYQWWPGPFGTTATVVRRTSEEDGTAEYPRQTSPNQWGYLITPMINFGMNSELQWVELNLKARNLVNVGDRIDVYLATDATVLEYDPFDGPDSRWALIASITADTDKRFDLTDISSSQAALRIDIFTGNETSTPELVRFGLRAFTKQRDFIVDVPINVSDMIEVPFRYPYQLAGYGDHVHRYLMRSVGDDALLEVFDPPIVVQGVIDAVGEPTMFVSERGSAGRYCLVRVRGNLITDQSYLVGMAFESDTADVGTVA